MIKSTRKFGVEIEFIAPSELAFNKIARRANIVHDGSLRPYRYGGEYVSPVLRGKYGVNTIHEVCQLLKMNGVDIENPATSVHVHLDGGIGEEKIVSSKTRPEDRGVRTIAISNRALRSLNDTQVREIVANRAYAEHYGFRTSSFSGIVYVSNADLSRRPLMNYTFFTLKRNDRFEWLQRVFYFYTQYSEQITAMVSNSRKKGNMYCLPLGQCYDVADIENAKNIDELRRVWYKGGDEGGNYNDSRYKDINLHSFFHRPGTVEFRSHGGTIDPDKILLWVRLHQHILDKLENTTLEDIKSSGAMYKNFLGFIDDELLEQYVRRLWGYFSKVTVAK